MFFLCLQIDHHARYSPWRRTTAAISLSKVLNAMIRFYNSALSRIAYSLKIHCRAAMSTHVREYVIFQPISKAMESVKTYVLSVSWTISFTNHSIWPYLPTYCCCRHFDVSNPAKAVLMTDGCQKTRAERVDKLEHVQMHIKLRHGHRGHLKLTLISPAGTRLVDDLSRVLNC